MQADTPIVKKQWNPELFLISSGEIENKTQTNHHEKTFISSQPAPSDFIKLFFKNAPAGGIVGLNTQHAYQS